MASGKVKSLLTTTYCSKHSNSFLNTDSYCLVHSAPSYSPTCQINMFSDDIRVLMQYSKNTTQRKSHSTKLLKQHIKTQLRKSNIVKFSFQKKTPRVSVFSNTTGASKIQIHNLGLHQKDKNAQIFGWCSELRGHV